MNHCQDCGTAEYEEMWECEDETCLCHHVRINGPYCNKECHDRWLKAELHSNHTCFNCNLPLATKKDEPCADCKRALALG